MKEFKQTAEQLSPEIYQQFKQAIATGKWPDGRKLEASQREIVMEAVILYEHANLPTDQHTGAMEDRCASETPDWEQEIKIQDHKTEH